MSRGTRFTLGLPVAALGLQLGAAACERPSALSEWRIVEAPGDFAPCTWQRTPHATPPGQPVQLRELETLCDAVAVPVAAIRPSAIGAHPDPGSRAVMTTDGRYYTREANPGGVLAWSAAGEHLMTAGRTGEGPGEFHPLGAINLFVGPEDSLYVLDGAQRWTVFGPDLTFERVFHGPYSGRNPKSVHVVGGGILTTADVVAGPAAHPYHLMDLDGALLRSFGELGSTGSPFGSGRRREQASAYDGRGGVWIARPDGAAQGPFLEHWSLQGHRKGEYQRQASWLPTTEYSHTSDPTEPLLPEHDYVHVDEDGLIWVAVVVRDPRWRAVDPEARPSLATELYEARVEVIDPLGGVVVASFRYDGPDDPLPPFARFFPLTRRAYRVVRDSLGLATLEMFDIHLVGRSSPTSQPQPAERRFSR